VSDGGRASEPEGPPAATDPPVPGARPLLDLVSGPAEVTALARRLLADAWLVEDLDAVPHDFAGIAVTSSGRAWLGRWRELRQVAQGGAAGRRGGRPPSRCPGRARGRAARCRAAPGRARIARVAPRGAGRAGRARRGAGAAGRSPGRGPGASGGRDRRTRRRAPRRAR